MRAEGWRTHDGRNLALSGRQRQVLRLLADGRTNAEIATALGMTLDGAKWHVSEIISKLGVRNREEAAAWWRSEHRALPRLMRSLAVARLAWLGAAGIAAVAIGAAIVAATMSGDDPQPAAITTPTSTPALATSTPTQAPLTAEEILHLSEQAMAATPLMRVETVSWPTTRSDIAPVFSVVEYSGSTRKWLYTSEHPLSECPANELTASPYGERSLGALAIYKEPRHQQRGASAPKEFEFLGEATLDGQDAWIVRYAYSFPSIEGPVHVEDTEWIAKDTHWLLRQERDYRDNFGFVGQYVLVVVPVEQPATDCPAAPLHSLEDLRPLTAPRISTSME